MFEGVQPCLSNKLAIFARTPPAKGPTFKNRSSKLHYFHPCHSSFETKSWEKDGANVTSILDFQSDEKDGSMPLSSFELALLIMSQVVNKLKLIPGWRADINKSLTMNYIQKYLEKLPMPKGSAKTVKGGSILLYCNYYSFYSQKVLMALYEKNVEFEPLVLDITKGEQYSSWFLEMNPRGEIPVLKVNNEIIPDSTRILDYLDKYLEPGLTPLINVSSDRKVLNNINKFRDLIEALPAGVITVGSFFHPHLCGRPKLPFILPVREVLKNGELGSSKNLRKLAEENPKAREMLLYKAGIQDRKHEILTNEEEYLKILNVVDQVLTHVEEQLKEQSEDMWLCCENFSIADVNLAVLLHRLWELGLEGRYWTGGKRPLTENYYHRVQQRESFKKVVPNLPLHIKMIVTSQPPAYIGAAGAASVGVVVAILYVFKKLIH